MVRSGHGNCKVEKFSRHRPPTQDTIPREREVHSRSGSARERRSSKGHPEPDRFQAGIDERAMVSEYTSQRTPPSLESQLLVLSLCPPSRSVRSSFFLQFALVGVGMVVLLCFVSGIRTEIMRIYEPSASPALGGRAKPSPNAFAQEKKSRVTERNSCLLCIFVCFFVFLPTDLD